MARFSTGGHKSYKKFQTSAFPFSLRNHLSF
jgi:hypothetical protein